MAEFTPRYPSDWQTFDEVSNKDQLSQSLESQDSAKQRQQSTSTYFLRESQADSVTDLLRKAEWVSSPIYPTIDQSIDLETIYYLTLDRRINREQLLEPDKETIKRALLNIDKFTGPAIQSLKEKYSENRPHPLWVSWMETVHPDKLEQFDETKR